jgi:hypothetical protein
MAKEIPMPALPWTTISPPDRAREYVVMASRLPLARYRDMPGFLRAAMLIRAQLARALVTERVARKPSAETSARQLVAENGASLDAVGW